MSKKTKRALARMGIISAIALVVANIVAPIVLAVCTCEFAWFGLWATLPGCAMMVLVIAQVCGDILED